MSTEPTASPESRNRDTPQEPQDGRPHSAQRVGRNPQQPATRSIFSVPAPIERLFNHFPLRKYPANELPQRAPRHRDENVLWIFTTEEGARRGSPSFNPACLKWQTYLKFNDIPFRIAISNNHASPSGALPFLLPASTPTGSAGKPTVVDPVPSNTLQKWCAKNTRSTIEEPGDMRYDAYLSLLDNRIRRAWLHSVYLSANSTSIAEPLYILPTSTNPFIRLSTSRTLRAAALAELHKTSPTGSLIIDAGSLYREANDAFAALETLLGEHEWFFGAERPGLFDASVFAYTHLLLIEEGEEGLGEGWVDGRLRELVVGRKALRAHRERILREYY